jgi:hypothetical protein
MSNDHRPDWARLRAVVIESDDWGLCAWVPDDAAWQALARTPAFRGRTGHVYGRSTLERAEDVHALAALLGAVRGGDGEPPVLQANTILACPDFARIDPDRASGPVPLVTAPALPARWERPGLWEAVREARERGVWWPELHGLHHLAEHAWCEALRTGAPDARAAFDARAFVCETVERSSEYDRAEPLEARRERLRKAVDAFEALFGRRARAFCPPDYRWDTRLDPDAQALGLEVFQGRAERGRLARLSSRWPAHGAPAVRRGRLDMPARIAFEPRGRTGDDAPLGVARAHRGCRAAWRRGQPAVVSTHRVNYAHLDAAWVAAGRAALASLLARLAADGAVFLTDVEVHDLVAHGAAVRPLDRHHVLVRRVTPGPVRWPLPTRASNPRFARGSGEVRIDGGALEAHVPAGAHVIGWSAG